MLLSILTRPTIVCGKLFSTRTNIVTQTGIIVPVRNTGTFKTRITSAGTWKRTNRFRRIGIPLKRIITQQSIKPV